MPFNSRFRPIMPPKDGVTPVKDGILTEKTDELTPKPPVAPAAPVAPVGPTYGGIVNPGSVPTSGSPAPKTGEIAMENNDRPAPTAPPPVTPPSTGVRPGGPVAVGANGDPTPPRNSAAIDNMQVARPTAAQGYDSQPMDGSGYRPSSAPPGTTRNPAVTPNSVMDKPATTIPKPITPETTPVGSGLRGEVYTPGADPRLKDAQAATDQMGRQVLNADRGGMQLGNEGRYRSIFGDGQVGASASSSERTDRYGQMQDDALAGLGGPSRTEMADKLLADWDAKGQQGLDARFRAVGQKAAALGRVGSGMVNAELGSVQGDYERDRLAARNQLAQSVIEGDIGDRFRRVDATSGLRRSEYGMDADRRDYTTGLGERNMDRSFDRTRASLDAATGQTDRSMRDNYDRFDAAGTLESRIFDQGRSNRDEYRGERKYQEDAAQRTIENRIREREIQQAEEEMRLRRAALQAQAGGN